MGVDLSRPASEAHGPGRPPAPVGQCRVCQSPCRDLNRWVSMPRALIFDSSVCRGRPNLAAADAFNFSLLEDPQ